MASSRERDKPGEVYEKKGFTLLEVLITLGVLAGFVVIVMAVLSAYFKILGYVLEERQNIYEVRLAAAKILEVLDESRRNGYVLEVSETGIIGVKEGEEPPPPVYLVSPGNNPSFQLYVEDGCLKTGGTIVAKNIKELSFARKEASGFLINGQAPSFQHAQFIEITVNAYEEGREDLDCTMKTLVSTKWLWTKS